MLEDIKTVIIPCSCQKCMKEYTCGIKQICEPCLMRTLAPMAEDLKSIIKKSKLKGYRRFAYHSLFTIVPIWMVGHWFDIKTELIALAFLCLGIIIVSLTTWLAEKF